MDPALAAFQRLFGPEFGHGKSFDLARLRRVLDKLGAPHKRLPPTIHVAGTNGKGSTIAFLGAILDASNLTRHAFVKPHLRELRERFLIAGRPINDAALIETAERVAALGEDLTQFEAQIAAAFLLFSRGPADIAIIETGMGGQDDATNVLVGPLACVITPIARDHEKELGPTLADIAHHKAGIIKPGAPIILARQIDEVRGVIEVEAARVGAPLYRQGAEWDAYASHGRLIVQTQSRALDLPLPSLHGAHQIDNAGLAAAALLIAAPWDIDETAYAKGVSSAQWPGRLQPLTSGALAAPIQAIGGEVWVDGGHNAHAAEALLKWAKSMHAKRAAPLVLILALRARKHWRAFVETLAPAAARIVALQLNQDFAAAADLAQAAGAQAETATTLADAMEKAARPIAGLGAPRVLICGSLELAAAALA
jgi:dihydrofolate synthase/folylpolyglutamate synthase